MLLGRGTETEVKPGHVSKAPTLTAFLYLPPSMVLGHATAATAGLKSGCVPLDPLVSLVLGSETETEVKPGHETKAPSLHAPLSMMLNSAKEAGLKSGCELPCP